MGRLFRAFLSAVVYSVAALPVFAADLGDKKPIACLFFRLSGGSVSCVSVQPLKKTNHETWRLAALGSVSAIATSMLMRELFVSSGAPRTSNEGLTVSISSGLGFSVADMHAVRNYTSSILPGFNLVSTFVGVPQGARSSVGTTSSIESMSIAYTRAFGVWTVGIAGEWLYLGSATDRTLPLGDVGPGLRTIVQPEWAASAAMRVGVDLSDRLNLWAQTGPALGRARIAAGLENNDILWSEKTSTKLGWTIGAGLDVRLSQGWLVGLSYSYFNLGVRQTSAVTTDFRYALNARSKVEAHALRISVGYRF